MTSKERNLVGKGEFDYDYYHDNLFFKVKNREYDKSLEFNNMVIDIDNDNFIIGVQIFHASQYFGITKQQIKSLFQWKFNASMKKIDKDKSMIEIRILFRTKFRNKILQPTPIITQNVDESFPESRMSCTPIKCTVN